MITKSIFIFLTLLAACAVPSADRIETHLQSPIPKKDLKLNIPKAPWEKIFFESINEVAKRDGFPKLRETVLPESDLEVRVWVGFGKAGIDGFILKRSSGNWSAIHLKRMGCHLENKAKVNLSSPKSNWEIVWQKLIDADILTLPDSSELKNNLMAADGKSFVVETNLDYTYRTYEYSQPDDQKGNEAKQIVKIGEIIVDEFGLESFDANIGGCNKNE